MPEGLKFNTEIVGEGTPIVFLHAWSMNLLYEKNLWEPVFAERLGWQRIYFDLPGHGYTPGPEWITNSDGILEAVWGLIDELTKGKAFALSGTSASGYFARGILHQHPERVLGLAGIVPMAYAQDDRRDLPPFKPAVVEESARELLAEKGLSVYEQFYSAQTEEVMNYVVGLEAIQLPGDKAFREIIRSDPKRYALSFDVEDLTAPFERPCFFVMGRQDHIVGYRGQWAFLENFPRASFAILDRAGHPAFIEQEALVRQLGGEWLDRVREPME